nr:triose-phosphate isomerase [Candidatus Sigynarchaeum springense]MDO8118475.1 triose-phosphate isomerase [Candidatus Sigynarchaeota archaeon]
MKNRPIIGGNWKMQKTIAESKSFIEEFLQKIEDLPEMVDIVIFPPFISIRAVSEALKGKKIYTGGQNMYFEEKGAFTGEISASMLLDAGASYVILGHSERRALFKETSEFISKKVKMAVMRGLKPILCIGETKDERITGKTEMVLKEQLTGSLNGINKDEMSSIVIAYEPVWAIGTGLTATPAQAQDAHAYVRKLLAEMYDQGVSRTTRIQYGGSIKPENAKEIFSQPDVDGGLVGGASLEAKSLVDIIKGAIS